MLQFLQQAHAPRRPRAHLRGWAREALLATAVSLPALVALLAGPQTAAAHPAVSGAAAAATLSTGETESWLNRYLALAAAQPSHCPRIDIPQLPDGVPQQAFVFHGLAGRTRPESGIVYSRDRVVERMLVLAEDAEGCVHATLTGRLLPLENRAVERPLANARIPATLGGTPPVAIVADAKSIRHWIEYAPESRFRDAAADEWALLGAYTGMLTVLLLVALGFVAWQRSGFALTLVAYLLVLQFYQLQALGLGPEWVPFWPGPDHARLTQAVAVALLVPGIAAVVLTILRPRRGPTVVMGSAVGLASAAFLSSAWTTWGYRMGALILAVLALLLLRQLLRRLRDADTALRWFAAGLGASWLGGTLQAASVVADRVALPGIFSVAFPIGNLVEAICWLIALACKFRDQHLADRRQLFRAAYHDSVTGLPNRHWLRERIATALTTAARRPSARRQLLLLDLDNFSAVNTACGHGGGDAVLAQVGAALGRVLEPGAALGRFGDDEFLLMLRPDQDPCAAEGRARSMLTKLAEPFRCGARVLRLRGSIGIVTLHAGYARIDDVIADAGLAQEAARRLGGNGAMRFDPSMRRAQHERERLREELAAAIESGQFLLHYQPVVALDTGRPLGFEALLRWRHPTRGLVPAAQFVPLAAAGGLIRDLGYQVIRLACAQLHTWQRRGAWYEGEYVSINLSAEQLGDERLLEVIKQAMQELGIDPSALRFEIPEAALAVADERPGFSAWRERLLGRQLLLCLDDFGAGRMPLAPLADLGFDSIKLDRSLAAGITHQGRAQSLVRAALALGQQFSSLVLAKGIESREQLDAFRHLGCGYGQGDYLAPAMPSEEVTAWVRLWQAERPRDPMSLYDSRLH
jgi:diguanylate cyclase (GGDEF)-like protein